MKVLGIDPGPKQAAYAVWDGRNILASGIEDNETIFLALPPCDLVAIEMITGYGMSVGQEVFETCRWEGKLEYVISTEFKKPVERIRRRDVKSYLCENPTAKDRDVHAALTDRIGPKGTKKDPGPTFGISGDIWAALGVAVYHWDKVAK